MRPSASLMLRFIQPAEVLEHHAPLLGRETGELVPRGVADFRTGAGRPGEQRGRNVDAVTRGGAAGALLLLIRLLAGEAAAGIEQLAVETLLPLDRAAIEPSRLELSGQLAGFLSKRTRGPGIASCLQTLELLSERALAAGELAQALHHRIAARRHHRQQSLRVAVHPLLLLRHTGELLERLLEAGSRLRAGDSLRCPHQRVRGRVSASSACSAKGAAVAGLGSPCSSCSRACFIWFCAYPSAASSCGDTSACRPAAALISSSMAWVPSSTAAWRARVEAPVSESRRCRSALGSCASESAASCPDALAPRESRRLAEFAASCMAP